MACKDVEGEVGLEVNENPVDELSYGTRAVVTTVMVCSKVGLCAWVCSVGFAVPPP